MGVPVVVDLQVCGRVVGQGEVGPIRLTRDSG